ncbi:type IV secretion system DNA-binding domain-containing protein [bacterium]|nr:type IV secretion system DNA-binding domain-containing protein [bacterium]
MENEIFFFGETTFRNQRKKFGIKLDDRRRHMYIIGKTGMGKTALLENMAIQDIQRGKGICFIDPHGDAGEKLLDFVPSHRIEDVVYFNPADLDFPIAFNIMEKVDLEHRHLVASELMGVFKKIWPDVWSARMEYILYNCILALLEYPNSTLLGINRMLADPEYRKKVVDKITDPVIKSFWTQEFARYTQRYEIEAAAAIQNKIGQFISAPLIRNIIGQVNSSIDMREIIDEGKILILNLSKGRIGEDSSRLLGALLITKLQLAAMSRANIPESERRDFFLYVDEFQNFATESFANILSEARKYRLSLILTHQYIAQMDEKVRDAVFGNVGTIISFRVGAEDAKFLEKEFSPEFSARDLVNLPKYNIYLKLTVDGVPSRPFSAITLPPFEKPKSSNKEKIIKFSREKYGTPRHIVEEKISRWAEILESTKVPETPPVLYDAQCWLCGKWTKVPFKPDGVRPVYCKSCRKKLEKQSKTASKDEEKLLSLKEALKRKPILFSSPKKVKEEKEKRRKEVNLNKLREALKEAIHEKEERKKEEEVQFTDKKGKIIKPGEVVKFEEDN